MIQPHVVNIANALVLLVAGTAAFLMKPQGPMLMLTAPLLGLIALACTRPIRNGNRLVKDTIMSLTLLVGVLSVMQIDFSRFAAIDKHLVLALLGLSCFVSVALFSWSNVQQRRLRNRS